VTKHQSNIDQNKMINDLIKVCNINSHSYNPEGVNKVGDFFISKFKNSFKDKIEIEVVNLDHHKVINDKAELEQRELGKMIFIKKESSTAKHKVLLMGHLDTVFPRESSFQECLQIDESTINGPGVADLKGGLLVMHKALELLEASEFADNISWTICLNPEEEIGSPESQKHFEKLAKEHDLGLIFEPSLSDGSIAWQRKGTGNFQLIVKGKAAHVGREFIKGQSAIFALAEFMTEANKLNSKEENIIINFGKVTGGGALNTVPDRAVLGINIRTQEDKDEKIALKHLNKIIENLNQKENLELTLHGKLNRKPKIPNERMEKLYIALKECADELGLSFEKRNTGGCCDGNNLYEYGLINIDTLGVRGGKIHSSEEFICLESLVERSELNARFLIKLAKNEVSI
jgi:glutamate carboxypeptidase